MTIMTTRIGTLVRSILDGASAIDHRYREARRAIEFDDHVLNDIGITRDELMAEFGIRRKPGSTVRTFGRRETNHWSSLANSRMARGRL